MEYDKAIEWMFQQLPMFQRQGATAMKKDLTNIRLMVERLGNPHKTLRFVHLAGTNGKGTCSHLIASLLQASDLRVGMYTSPHYKDYRERIKINGQQVSKNFVQDFIQRHQSTFEDIRPSFFEWSFAMSLAYFAEQKVDWVVLETGLGGRLDSTNIVDPEICLITNIGFDHQQFLGDTLPEIAGEKAGIIKSGTPVVIGEYQEEIFSVFTKKANVESSPIYVAERLVQVLEQEDKFIVHGLFDHSFEVKADIGGPFAARNIQSSLATFQVLYSKHLELKLDEEQISRALSQAAKNTYYIGRWMLIGQNPIILMDSAHNAEGISGILNALGQKEFDRLHIVFATVGDKDLSGVLPLFPQGASYYFTQAKIPRAKMADQLKDEAKTFGLIGKAFADSTLAMEAAKQNAKQSDLILVIGSIFIVAELI